MRNQHPMAKKYIYFPQSTRRFLGKNSNLSIHINILFSAPLPPYNHPPKEMTY